MFPLTGAHVLKLTRIDTPSATQHTHGNTEPSTLPGMSDAGPRLGTASTSQAATTLIDDFPSTPLISFGDQPSHPARHAESSPARPPLLTPAASSSAPTSRKTSPDPPRGLLNELLEHEDDPMYFTSSRSASTSRATTPQPRPTPGALDASRPSRHPTRESNWTEPAASTHGPPARSPSLPPTPSHLSNPEVQRTQSFFMPTSFTASSFPTKWVSSLLSRPAPSVAQPPAPHVEGLPPRASTIPGAAPITHGTPFAAHTYVPPSGAPGFAGDRAWNKGFDFDKENVERTSVKLVGRKEGTHAILSVQLADQVRVSGLCLGREVDALAPAAAVSASIEETAAIMDIALQFGPARYIAEHALHAV